MKMKWKDVDKALGQVHCKYSINVCHDYGYGGCECFQKHNKLPIGRLSSRFECKMLSPKQGYFFRPMIPNIRKSLRVVKRCLWFQHLPCLCFAFLPTTHHRWIVLIPLKPRMNIISKCDDLPSFEALGPGAGRLLFAQRSCPTPFSFLAQPGSHRRGSPQHPRLAFTASSQPWRSSGPWGVRRLQERF